MRGELKWALTCTLGGICRSGKLVFYLIVFYECLVRFLSRVPIVFTKGCLDSEEVQDLKP